MTKERRENWMVNSCFFFFFPNLLPVKILCILKWTNKIYHSFMISCYSPEVKEIFEIIPKNLTAERFFKNQFCMLQSFKGKKNLEVFKTVLKLASYQIYSINANLRQEVLRKF